VIVILGAGPAGLGAAHHLRTDFVLVEALGEPGGLCRSFSLAGATFDYGGHAFFTKDEAVAQLIESLAPQPLHRQRRAAWVWSSERFVPYPFQAHLYGLPAQVIEDCLAGLLESPDDPASPSSGTLDRWLRRSLGEGIFEHFLRPYNEKLWAYPLRDIVPRWSDERVVRTDVRAIVRGALTAARFDAFPNHEVCYPAQGGFVELYRPMFAAVKQRCEMQQPARRLDLAARWVETSGGRRLSYDRLISTIPLPNLVEITVDPPDAVRDAASQLDHNSLLLVNLVARLTRHDEKHRIYCADPALPFHKLAFNHTSSPSLRETGVSAIQAEISYSRHKPVDAVGALRDTIDGLRRVGVFDDATELIATDVVDVPLAYPVYTARSLAAAATLCSFYESHGVLSIGRFGEWGYINSDVAVRRGIEAAAHAREGRAEPFPRLHR
jgi:protoporphyrinogen oxidase